MLYHTPTKDQPIKAAREASILKDIYVAKEISNRIQYKDGGSELTNLGSHQKKKQKKNKATSCRSSFEENVMSRLWDKSSRLQRRKATT